MINDLPISLVNNTPYKALGIETNGMYSLVIEHTAPGGGPPLHSHANEGEGFYVQLGVYRFWIGDDAPVDVYPGAHVFGPRGVIHRFQNVSDVPGEMLIIFTPPGCENYFKALEAVRKAGGADLTEKERAIDRKYGISIQRGS